MSFENFKKRVHGTRIDGTNPEDDRQRVIKLIKVYEAAKEVYEADHYDMKRLGEALAELEDG